MPLDPRITHALDQLSGLTGEVAKAVASYKAKLIEEGLSEGEAWELARRLEDRLLGTSFDDTRDFIADVEDDGK